MFATAVDFTQIELALFTATIPPLLYVISRYAVDALVRVLAPYIGQQQALVVQQRANELLDKGIGAATLKALPWIQAHGLTLDVQNMITREVAQYAVDHAADLATEIGGLEQKALARLITHPAVQAALATRASGTEPAQAKAA